jgi:hypothetical protein
MDFGRPSARLALDVAHEFGSRQAQCVVRKSLGVRVLHDFD